MDSRTSAMIGICFSLSTILFAGASIVVLLVTAGCYPVDPSILQEVAGAEFQPADRPPPELTLCQECKSVGYAACDPRLPTAERDECILRASINCLCAPGNQHPDCAACAMSTSSSTIASVIYDCMCPGSP